MARLPLPWEGQPQLSDWALVGGVWRGCGASAQQAAWRAGAHSWRHAPGLGPSPVWMGRGQGIDRACMTKWYGGGACLT